MMRLLDRYILSIFLPALVMFTVTFVFLVLAIDFASKLGRFLEIPNSAMFVLEYYACRLPMMVSYLLPCVMLFAPMFTVIKLARTNEILPIAASGISLRRMSLPFVAASILACGTMAALDEYVLSNLGDKISDTENTVGSSVVDYSVEDWDGWTKIWGVRYDTMTKEMSQQVRITRVDDLAHPIEIVRATNCRWEPARKRWVAYHGEIEYPQKPLVHVDGQKPQAYKEPIPPTGYVVNSALLKPETLRRKSSLTSRLPFAKLRTLRQEAKLYPRVPPVQMKYWGRFSFPLSPLVLLLLGLPFVVAAQSKSFIRGLLICFVLALSYYLTYFAFMDAGNRGTIPPPWAAWTPTVLFGLFGIVAFSRMKT